MFTNFFYNCGNLALGGSSDSAVAQGVSCFPVLSAAESCCRAFFVGLVGLCVGGVRLAYKNGPGRGYFFFRERSITIKYLMGGRNFKPDVELVGGAPSD